MSKRIGMVIVFMLVLSMSAFAQLQIKNSAATPAVLMHITQDGNVGIGTTVPGTFMLNVQGTTGTRTQALNINDAYNMPTSNAVGFLFNNGTGTVTWSGSTGDNWGTQVVQKNTTNFTGDGTTATPLTLATNGVLLANMADNSVQSAEIVDLSVATVDIANSAITAGKLAATGGGTTIKYLSLDATGTAMTWQTISGGDNWGSQVVQHDATLTGTGITGNLLGLADNAVTNAKMADNAVGTVELINSAVTVGKLAATGGGTSIKYLTLDAAGTTMTWSTIAGDNWGTQVVQVNATNFTGNGTTASPLTLATNAVALANMQDNSVQSAEIVDLGVATADIANLAVTTAKIADLNVTNAKIANSAVTVGKISATGAGTSIKYLTLDATGTTMTWTTGAGVAEGNDTDIGAGNVVNIESQLDFVSTITRASSDLTLSTTTSGDVVLSPVGGVGFGTAAPAANTMQLQGKSLVITNAGGTNTFTITAN